MSDSPHALLDDLASLKIDRQPTAAAPVRRRSRWWFGWLFAAALVSLLALGRPYLEAQLLGTPVELTRVSVLRSGAPAASLSSSGYVVPEVRSLVGARVPGRVARALVRQGDEVQQGQVLLELEPTVQQTAVESARLRAQVARANVAAARSRWREVTQQYRRQQSLLAQGATPAGPVEDMRNRAVSFQRDFSVAKAQVDAADGEVASLLASLDDLTIRAPVSGMVLNKPPAVGQMVGNDLGLGTTPAVVEIADMSSLVIETDVPESRLHLVKLGSPCAVILDAYPGKRFSAEAVALLPRADRAKATVAVKVKLLGDVSGVLPEMAARVEFLSAPEPAHPVAAKTVIPAGALVERNGARYVFVLQEDRAQLVEVAVGETLGTSIELKRGPAPGTQIVKAPPLNLHDGAKVRASQSRAL